MVASLFVFATAQAQSFSGFALVNVETSDINMPDTIQVINPGDRLDLASLPPSITLLVIQTDTTFKDFEFVLEIDGEEDGSPQASNISGGNPLYVFGDLGSSNNMILPVAHDFRVGSYTLTVRLKNDPTDSFTMSFEVVRSIDIQSLFLTGQNGEEEIDLQDGVFDVSGVLSDSLSLIARLSPIGNMDTGVIAFSLENMASSFSLSGTSLIDGTPEVVIGNLPVTNSSLDAYDLNLSSPDTSFLILPNTSINFNVDRIRLSNIQLVTKGTIEEGSTFDLDTDKSALSIAAEYSDPGSNLASVRFQLDRMAPGEIDFEPIFDDSVTEVPYGIQPASFPNIGTYRLITTPFLENEGEITESIDTTTFSITGNAIISGFELESTERFQINPNQTFSLDNPAFDGRIDTTQLDIVAQFAGFEDIITPVQFDLYDTEPSEGISPICSHTDSVPPFRVFAGDCSSQSLSVGTRYWLVTQINPKGIPENEYTLVNSMSADTSYTLPNFGIVETSLDFFIEDQDGTRTPKIANNDTLDLLLYADSLDLDRLNFVASVNDSMSIEGVNYTRVSLPRENCFGANEIDSSTSQRLLLDSGTFCYGTYELDVTLLPENQLQSLTFTLLGPRVEDFSFFGVLADSISSPLNPIAPDEILNINEVKGNLNIKINGFDTAVPRISDVTIKLISLGGLGEQDVIPRDDYAMLPENVFPTFWVNPLNGQYRLSTTYTVDDIGYSASVDFSIVNALPIIGATAFVRLRENGAIATINNSSLIDVTELADESIDMTLEISAAATNIDSVHVISNFEFNTGVSISQSYRADQDAVQPTRSILQIDLKPAELTAYTSGTLVLNLEVFHPNFETTNRDTLTFDVLGPRPINYALVDSISGDTISVISSDPIEVINRNDLPNSLLLQAQLKDPREVIESVEFLPINNPFEINSNSTIESSLARSLINPTTEGIYEIEVRWSNENFSEGFGSDLIKFKLDGPPLITNTEGIAPSQSEVEVKTTISDSVVVNPTLLYRFAGDSCYPFSADGCFASIPLNLSDTGTYSAEISRFFDNASRSIEFFIIAEDENGFVARDPQDTTQIKSIPIRIVDPGLNNTNRQPASVFEDQQADPTAYRLISMPLDLDNKTVASVLGDDLFEADSTQWRLFDPHTREELSQTDTSVFQPGSAFWLITRNEIDNIDTGAGRTIPTDSVYQLNLQSPENCGSATSQRGCWSYFGNPFNFPLPVENLARNDGDTTPIQLWTYTEEEWQPVTTGSLIEPFKGYVMDNSLQTHSLLIDPIIRSESILAGKASRKSLNTTKKQTESWDLRISARKRNAIDSYNFASVNPAASDDWDLEDWAEPPIIGDYVSLYFPRPEWDAQFTKFSKDSRQPSENGGYIWPFEVITSKPDIITLSLPDLTMLPDKYEAVLVDPLLSISQNLIDEPEYSFRGTVEPRAFTLVVGNKAFIEAQQKSVDLIPATHELHPNFPNPFSTTTTIRYGLPETDHVTLEIYNMIGQRVAVIEEGNKRDAGYHAVVWDGRGMAGDLLGSGVYFARMQSSAFTKTIKLVLVH